MSIFPGGRISDLCSLQEKWVWEWIVKLRHYAPTAVQSLVECIVWSPEYSQHASHNNCPQTNRSSCGRHKQSGIQILVTAPHAGIVESNADENRADHHQCLVSPFIQSKDTEHNKQSSVCTQRNPFYTVRLPPPLRGLQIMDYYTRLVQAEKDS